MADGVTGVITSLIGAAGAAAPGVANVIAQRKAERDAKKQAAYDAANPQMLTTTGTVVTAKPWPTWLKVALGVAGTAVVVGAGYYVLQGSKKKRRR